MSAEEFLNKYRALCLESGFCLVSDDPWVRCTLASFHYE